MRVGRRRYSGGDAVPSPPVDPLAELVALASEPLDLNDGTIPPEVHYREAEKCGNCDHFQRPKTCVLFNAEVERGYVCDKWEQRETS